MADYWLTFRITEETVSGETASVRRNALYDYIDNISEGWWIEPTSFVAFDSGQGIDAIAAGCGAAIARSRDVVFIHRIGYKTARLVGTAEYADTLRAYFPYAEMV